MTSSTLIAAFGVTYATFVILVAVGVITLKRRILDPRWESAGG